MKIYINNEEVLCASKMTIKHQLKNTSSVILNNVYPKSWETDKDYVSRFYMPKDYSPCKIIDENILTNSKYELTDNVRTLNNRWINISGSSIVIIYSNTLSSKYIQVIPGYTYTIKLKNKFSSNMPIYQTNELKIGSIVNALFSATPGEQTIQVTPTKKYLLVSDQYIDFQKIEITVPDNLIFSGIVKNSGNINLNPRYPHYSTLQLLDYKTFLSEGDTLNYVLEEQKISSAIKRILKDVDGFMVGEIKLENDDVIAPYNCNDKTIYDVFEYLAEISNSIWFTKPINDKLILINFYSEGNLKQSDNIEYTQEYFQNNNIVDIKYSYNTKDYRNKQVIISNQASSGTTQIEYIMYNGQNLKTTYPIESIVSITSGSSNYSVSTLQAKQNGTYASFYYNYNSNDIEINRSFETGKTFKVVYYSVVTTRQAVYNQNEIDRISNSTGRNGTLARYEKRTDTNNNEALNQIAQSYLNYKGTPEVILTIKSYKSDLFNIGNRVLFEGPLQDLTTNYLVIEKEVEMITTGSQQEIFYTYKLSSSFNDESNINFFDNQRRKLEGNIREGQYITRYIDIPSETNIIFYDLSKDEIVIPGDILDGELDIELAGLLGNNKLNAKLGFKL